GKRADEKAEGERRNWFWVGSSCCSAPYIWGTVSVLLGFSWWITVSASLACFPHVSASLRVVRPRAVPLHRGNYFCGNMVHIVIVASGCGWVEDFGLAVDLAFGSSRRAEKMPELDYLEEMGKWGKRADEKAEGERRNWFWVGSSCCSAPYIWGTVSVLLGFSWWITVSASLACFPHVSASLRVVRPPCRAAPSRKLFLWEYGAYCDRSIGLRVGGSAGGSQCLLVWPASLTSQLLCEWSGPRAVPLHRGNYFCGEYGAYCDRSIGLRVGTKINRALCPLNVVTLYNFGLIARARPGDVSFKCLPYQLSMVGYAPTMVVTGDGNQGSIPEREPENGYHIQGRQQARKLPTPGTGR
ncbi:hypothetical protein JTE90_006528, partial [Oedothorax gibbosus]